MSSPRQEQRGGLGSTNLQVNKLEVHNGISVSDAHQIAQTVFEGNFWRVHDVAQQLASKRAAEMREEIISELARRSPEALEELNDPEKQVAVYEAQKSYALTGDPDLKALLSQMVVEIAEERGRTLKSIVLKESLAVVPKLTANQLNILALKFLVSVVTFHASRDVHELAKTLRLVTTPFTEQLRWDSIQFRHLIYTGCGESTVVDILHIAKDLQRIYPKLFSDMKDEKVGATLLAAEPRLTPLIDGWNKSGIGGFRLTSVGLLVAQTFVSKKIKISIDVEVWS